MAGTTFATRAVVAAVASEASAVLGAVGAAGEELRLGETAREDAGVVSLEASAGGVGSCSRTALALMLLHRLRPWKSGSSLGSGGRLGMVAVKQANEEMQVLVNRSVGLTVWRSSTPA